MSRNSWLAPAPRVRLSVALPLLALALTAGLYVGQRRPTLLSEQPLDVRCLVEAVKAELVAAEEAQRKQNLAALFQLKDFEMEINYLVRNSGGIKAEVVGVGTNLDTGSERVQKLRLRWEAIPNRDESIPPSLSIDQWDSKREGSTASTASISHQTTGCNSSREAK